MKTLIGTLVGKVKEGRFRATFGLVVTVFVLVDLIVHWRLFARGSVLLVSPVVFPLLVIRSIVEALLVTCAFQCLFRSRTKG